MKTIQNAAFVSVGRAAGFAGLAIVCVMLGLAFEPANALKVGGGLCLIVAVVLYAYGRHALVRPYRHTETWLILPKDDAPPGAVAQRVIGQALHDTYLWFAFQATIVGAVLFTAGVVLTFFPFS